VLVTGGSGFIGTNLMRSFIERGVHVLDVDWNPPLDLEQRPWWRWTDIMDQAATRMAFIEFQPTHVVHLAARADADEGGPDGLCAEP
ncbi:MAG: NAD-dependent epimerase/dehydratase family protein, partial [Gammaproteobacteria bacterium]